jgi:hypothetical protein
MTFGEARTAHLKQFNAAAAKVRAIVQDPGWCNTDYPDYKIAFGEMVSACDAMSKLNLAEMYAARAAATE